MFTRAGQRAERQLLNEENSAADVAACHALVAVLTGQDRRFTVQPSWHATCAPSSPSNPQVEASALETDDAGHQTVFALATLAVHQLIADKGETGDEAQTHEQSEVIVFEYTHWPSDKPRGLELAARSVSY